jgi:hypothetical protein
MKKLLILLTSLWCTCLTIHAQTPTPPSGSMPNPDSMLNAQNPGDYYLQYLKSTLDYSDTVESSSNREAIRKFSLWVSRLPTGDSSANPFLKYAKALKRSTAAVSTCTVDDFNGNWENTGPKNTPTMDQGIVYAIYSPPSNPNKIMVGFANGGLWRTIDGGINWTCLSDQFLSTGTIGINTITGNPNNENEVYIGTGIYHTNLEAWGYGNGVWFSPDFGNTWTIDMTADPITLNPEFESRNVLEYCPFLVYNPITTNNEPMVWGAKPSGGNNTDMFKKLGSSPTTILNNSYAVLPKLNNMINDITFNESVYGEALVSFLLGWGRCYPYPSCTTSFPNGVPYYGMLYKVTYDATGEITNWQKLADENDIFTFGQPNIFGPIEGAGDGFSHVYIGNHQYYVTVVNDFHQRSNVYLLDVSTPTPTWTLIKDNIFTVANSRWCQSIDYKPHSPNLIYLGLSTPVILEKVGLTWNKIFPRGYAHYPDFHPDVRVVKIHNQLDANNKPISFWGHDGGISKGYVVNGNQNEFDDINGNMITNLVVDVDISNIKRKRAIASMHSSYSGTTGTVGQWWSPPFLPEGDGINAIYDHRENNATDQKITFSANVALFDGYNHATNTKVWSFNFIPPTSLEDFDRWDPYPSQFVDNTGKMYIGNTNMFESLGTGAGQYQPWTQLTGDQSNEPIFDNTLEKVGDICKSIVVSEQNPEIKYIGFRYRPDHKDRTMYVRKETAPAFYEWINCTPPQIEFQDFYLTDIVIDPMAPNRVFVSIGGVYWWTPNTNRVLYSDDYGATWSDMSTGLTELPVTCLAYQTGSDDIIYAATDAGVYRWDKPLGCWVKFDDGLVTGTKMPKVLTTDLEIDYCAGRLIASSYGRGVWETDLYKPGFGYGISGGKYSDIISTNTIWNATRSIKGNILVKSGAQLTILGTANLTNNTSTTTIYMPKDGIIDIEVGGTLAMDGAKITNGCDAMWYGINVWGDLPFSPGPYQGYAKAGNCIFENAHEALNNFNPSVTNGQGGKISMWNCNFVNNRRSAQYHKYNDYISGDNWFINCNFDINDDYLEEEGGPFSAHITMWDVHQIGISGCEFQNNRTSTIHHEKAIFSEDATYRLSLSTITGFETGVKSDAFYTSIFPLQINGNTFDQNENGMSIMGFANSPKFYNNTYNIGKYQQGWDGVSTGFGYQSIGAKLNYVSNFVYKDNQHSRLYNPPDQGINNYTIGTMLRNTGDIDQPIVRNAYQDLEIGNQSIGLCGNQFITRGVYYVCNTNIDNKEVDFLIHWNTNIRNFQSSNLAAPFTWPAGNTFTQNNPNVKHWVHTTPGNAPVTYLYGFGNPAENPTLYNTTQLSKKMGIGTAPCNSFFAPPIENEADLLANKTQFEAAKASYATLKNTYDGLLDNGSTTLTINEIDGTPLSEQMQLRNNMLLRSPYLSNEALRELVLENILSSGMLFEVLMANPDATKSEEFIQFLENEAPTPLAPYMINLIRASWTGTTARTGMENMLAYENDRMTQLSNEIVYFYGSDSLQTNEDSVIMWMSKVPSVSNHYFLVDMHLINKNYAQALTILNNIPLQFKLSTQELYDYQSFVNFYNFKKNIIENDISLE